MCWGGGCGGWAEGKGESGGEKNCNIDVKRIPINYLQNMEIYYIRFSISMSIIFENKNLNHSSKRNIYTEVKVAIKTFVNL